MAVPDFALEYSLLSAGLRWIAGVDEVGRGPLAGPVAVAAVILNPADLPDGLNDSKLISAARREALYPLILDKALAVAFAFGPPAEIDAFNIRGATLKVMARAVAALAITPDIALIDGRDIPPDLPCSARAIVKGDAKHLSIAAASIVAKVARDALMRRLETQYPGYGFARNAGYGTARHIEALKRLGPAPPHRVSFRAKL